MICGMQCEASSVLNKEVKLKKYIFCLSHFVGMVGRYYTYNNIVSYRFLYMEDI